MTTYLDQLLSLRKDSINILGRDHGVRIDIVDNYQGEESDIIILSLVRSNNPENKIGFLNVSFTYYFEDFKCGNIFQISNRVCVALSRARMGLYVICNMDFLASNSTLWEKIRQSAVSVGAVGSELIVKCQMHGNEQVGFRESARILI